MRRLLSVHVTYRHLVVGCVLCNVVRMVLGHGRADGTPVTVLHVETRLQHTTQLPGQRTLLRRISGMYLWVCLQWWPPGVTSRGLGIYRERGWVGPVEGRRCVGGGYPRSHGIYPVPLRTWDLGYPLPYWHLVVAPKHVWLASGWYASCWNAFFFCLFFVKSNLSELGDFTCNIL